MTHMHPAEVTCETHSLLKQGFCYRIWGTSEHWDRIWQSLHLNTGDTDISGGGGRAETCLQSDTIAKR